MSKNKLNSSKSYLLCNWIPKSSDSLPLLDGYHQNLKANEEQTMESILTFAWSIRFNHGKASQGNLQGAQAIASLLPKRIWSRISGRIWSEYKWFQGKSKDYRFQTCMYKFMHEVLKKTGGCWVCFVVCP